MEVLRTCTPNRALTYCSRADLLPTVAVVGLNIARGPDIQDPEASDHELGIIMRDTAAAASTSMTEATKSTTPPGSTLTTMTGTTTTTTRIRVNVWFRDRSLVVYVLV